MKKYSTIKFLRLLPVWGMILFVLLYFAAAGLYPGGSEVDRSADGFSWLHNYWCDLLEDHAENGQRNTAKTTAIVAMSVLSLSIMLFWVFVPALFKFSRLWKTALRIAGVLSMGILAFLQADYHDLVINTSVILGVIAMVITLAGLYSIGENGLLLYGFACLLLALLNNYIYYTKNWIHLLAIIQKISFLLFLVWFALVNLLLLRKK